MTFNFEKFENFNLEDLMHKAKQLNGKLDDSGGKYSKNTGKRQLINY